MMYMAMADIADIVREARDAWDRRSRRRHWQKWLEREERQKKKDLARQEKLNETLRKKVRIWIATAAKLNEKEQHIECNDKQGFRSCFGRLCRRR